MSWMAFASALTFNLVCTGQSSVIWEKGGKPESGQFEQIIRVDLTSRRWCVDTCKETAPIHTVAEQELIFEKMDNSPIMKWELRKVQRESGAYIRMSRFGGYTRVDDGECSIADFTGFPARKF